MERILMRGVPKRRVEVKVRKLFRPDNCVGHLTRPKARRKNLHALYWTEELTWVDATTIAGKCHVVPKAKLEREGQLRMGWTEEGENR